MAKEPITGKNSKKAPAPIKVKQDMIDFIKAQGMTAALKRAGQIKASGTKGEAEFLEGIRRMYGERRLAEATGAAKPKKATPKGAIVDGTKKPSSVTSKKSTSKPGDYKSSLKGTGAGNKSNDNLKSNILKGVGTAAGIAALVASRGKASGAVAKLSPGLAGFAKSGVGKALFGSGETASQKVLAATGRVAGKTKGGVTQSQFDAMTAAAKAKGIKLPPVKAGAKTTPKVTPKAKPKTTPKATPKTTPKATPKTTPKATPKATPKTTPKESYTMPKITKKKAFVLTGVGGTAGLGAVPTKKKAKK